jgi:uncharacterized protein
VIVVADTTILLNLRAIGRDSLLQQMFGVVLVPPEVRQEFEHAVQAMPRFAGLTFPLWVSVKPGSVQVPALRADPGLDPGELAALELAVEIMADVVLLDEAHGRKAAVRVGLRVFGLLGILLRAKEAQLLVAVAPVLDELKTVRFFLSNAERVKCLRLAGELQ